MPYVTIKKNPSLYQMTFDDILDGKVDMSKMSNQPSTCTYTKYKKELDRNFLKQFDFNFMISKLKDFNEQVSELADKDRLTLYNNFYQEKRDKGMSYIFKQIFKSQKKYIKCDSSEVCREISKIIRRVLSNHPAVEDEGLVNGAINDCVNYLISAGFIISSEEMHEIFKSAYRKIDNPCSELKSRLTELKRIFEDDMFALYHTSAFAYIKGRSALDSVKRHQQNESRWFAKFDFSNFFGSTTENFVISMFSQIFPFSEIVKRTDGAEALRRAIDLCFLNGGLPQGTPISPTITNVMMIPIDYKISNELRKEDKHFIYTRYADDILISSRYDFDCKKIQQYLIDTLKIFNAPFTIKEEKTRYGSSAGRNWNLGVMLNKDNNITIGHQRKKAFKATCHNYIMSKQNRQEWSLDEVQSFNGLISYFKMIEKDYIEYVIRHYNEKFHINLESMIKEDLKRI